MTTTIDDFKQRQRDMWAAGDYATVAEHTAQVGDLLVRRVEVAAEMRVLDVACGAGNAALPAARAGARVAGLDLVPDLLEAGREKAAAERLDIDWVEGDAEALPFGDDAFDHVLSTFGHMFAPRHRLAAEEIARVARKGGVIGFCCWTPEGVTGEIFRVVGSYMPPPPDFASPPLLWGTEDHVREMFASVANGFEFERHSATIEWESIDGWGDFFLDRFGPFVTARRMLGERFESMRAEILDIWAGWNEADDGRLVLPQEYLLSIIRL